MHIPSRLVRLCFGSQLILTQIATISPDLIVKRFEPVSLHYPQW